VNVEGSVSAVQIREPSQADRILAYMKKGRTLTPLEALEKFGCFRLGARVWQLKKAGHDIRSRLVDVNGKKVSRYLLVQ
jgi:hypothetical protein